MTDLLKKVLGLAQALTKLIPVIIEVLGDVLDDGELNESNGGTARRAIKRNSTKG